MKSILLFRHGKSNWKAQYEKDHERPLSKRGMQAAELMGKYIFQIKQVPDKVISSTAIRAKSTAELASKFGNWHSDFVLDPDIYHCSTDKLQNIIAKQNSNINFICLVGHEPTFSSFLSKITGEDLVHFPTASVAKINLPINRWKEIERGQGFLSFLKRPKELMPFKTTI